VRNVIVTGGSRGLGLCIAQKLTQSGYSVVAIARKDSEQLTAAIAETTRNNRGALSFVPFDLTEIAEIPRLVRTVRRDVGPIYGLVNNAAMELHGALAMMHNAQIEQLIRLNTLSPIVLTKYVVRSMLADGGGRIVNISSITSSTGYTGLSVYGATKASMIGFTRSLAREVGPRGVTVNSVAPGFLDTEMTQSLDDQQRQQIIRRSALHRLAAVEDVANAVEFFLSDKSQSITGTVLTVDAGSTA